MKALTQKQTDIVTTKLSLGVEFLNDAINENPEIWENSAFRCAIVSLTDANKICRKRVYPSLENKYTRKGFQELAWRRQKELA